MKLIIISAPSGAGKTTLCKKLLDAYPEKLVLSISSTTRKPRPNEKHGISYFFITDQEFKKDVDQGKFAEWAFVHGKYYGTSKKVIEDAFADGKSVLLDIDVQGAKQLRKSFPQQCLTIFVSPPSLEELEKRLLARGSETMESLTERIQNAKDEMKEASFFDYVLVNDDLEDTFEKLEKIIFG